MAYIIQEGAARNQPPRQEGDAAAIYPGAFTLETRAALRMIQGIAFLDIKRRIQ